MKTIRGDKLMDLSGRWMLVIGGSGLEECQDSRLDPLRMQCSRRRGHNGGREKRKQNNGCEF